jgi:hypothetical protein
MSTEIKKLAELEYDEMITLAVIESDDILTDIFKEEIKISFNMIRTIAKDNELNKETKELLFEIFEGIILPTKRYINKYIGFGGIATSNGFINEEVVEEIIEIENPIIEDKVDKPTSVKKEKAFSKWYGKKRLVKEITEQGGIATPTQRAMLELNELKNIYSKLLAKGIKDLETGSNILSEEDCRTIESIVVLAKRRLNKVLTKKK